MARRYEGRKFLKPTTIRRIVVAAIALAIVASCAFHLGLGTLSAFGVGQFYLLCPLGALESMLASRSVVLSALISLAVVLVLGVVFGKAFCAWACPVNVLSRFLSGKKKRAKQHAEQEESASQALEKFNELGLAHACVGCSGCSGGQAAAHDGAIAGDASSGAAKRLAPEVAAENPSADALEAIGEAPKRKFSFDSRYLVLLGALVSAFIFGFPVFCLICPIGLTFGTVVSIVRLIGFNEPSWGLILFPAIIVIELVVLKKWCHMLCPVSAIISLVSTFNRTFRPKADEEKCLRTAGEPCAVCASVCPEHIDPRSDLGTRPLSECTRCGACVEACPRGALSFVKVRKGPRKSMDSGDATSPGSAAKSVAAESAAAEE